MTKCGAFQQPLRRVSNTFALFPGDSSLDCGPVIAYLQGQLAEAAPTRVVVDCGGVGYVLFIPVSSYDRLPAVGAAIKVLTHHHVVAHEGTQQLYGFMTEAERAMFLMLISISGIGPKAALNILSSASLSSLREAIVAGDTKLLSSLRGIGKKTAERLVVELKEKLGGDGSFTLGGPAGTAGDQRTTDAIQALVSLGYKQADAHKAIVRSAEKAGADASVEDLVRGALRGG